MADTKISALSGVASVAAGNEFAVNEAGTSKKATATQVAAFVQADILANGATFPNTGLHILDSNGSHDLIIKPGSDLASDRELTITTGDAARTISLGANLTIPADPNADRLLVWDDSAGATAYFSVGAGLSVAGVGGTTLVGPLKGYIYGLTTSDADGNDKSIAVGEATDETGVDILVLGGALIKQIDAGWVVGTNQGGLNTGAVADNTWYEIILIKRVDTGVVDVMFTTTANRATLPANYTLGRRIGWVRRGTATNLLTTQVDDYFTLATQVNDASITATATAAAIAVTVPPGAIGRFRISSDSNTDNAVNQVTVFQEVAEGLVTPSDATGIASIGVHDIAGSQASHMELRVSATSTIRHDSTHTANVIDVSTFGWIDHRRRLS